jgi:preprotein translocase subunit YajC
MESQLPISLFHSLILAAEEPPSGIMSLLTSPMFPIFAIMLLFMMVMLPSERRRKAEQAKMLDGLAKNDRVVTVGGLVGTVVNAQKGDEMVALRIDENNNTRVTVLRSAIARVLTESDPQKKDALKKEKSDT